MPAERKDEVLGIGQSLGPVAENHTEQEVFVDDDHGAVKDVTLLAVVSVLPAKDRIVHEIGVERCLKLVGQVAGRDAAQSGSSGFRHTRIPGSAPAAPLLGDVDGGHAIHCAAPASVAGPGVSTDGLVGRGDRSIPPRQPTSGNKGN